MNSPRPSEFERWKVDGLLRKYEGLAIRPSGGRSLVVAGELEFCVERRGHDTHCDTFSVVIRVPANFPQNLPLAWETGGRIPPDFHKLENEALCLGAPLGLKLRLGEDADLLRFVERCLIPYLYGFAIFERTGVMPFGELDHGNKGLLVEYKSIFGVDDDEVCIALLHLAGVKKRIANKGQCPCGSGLRLGRCHHRRVNRLRPFGSRVSFRFLAIELAKKSTRKPSTPLLSSTAVTEAITRATIAAAA